MATGKKAKDNDHHGGQDYARGLGYVGNKYYMYAQTDSTITQESFMALVFQRRGIPDRIAHLHLNHDSREGAVGRVLKGTKLANPLQYGTAFKSVGEVIGRLSGRGDSEHSYATHEHIEYHVLARDPRVGVRILSKNGQAIKGNTTHFRSKNLLSKGMTLRQISPTPYLAHDTPLQGGVLQGLQVLMLAIRLLPIIMQYTEHNYQQVCLHLQQWVRRLSKVLLWQEKACQLPYLMVLPMQGWIYR